jgi:hypothetical protein
VPAPHWQAPEAEQLSERKASQATQVDPLEPQATNARVWQTVPAQHPAAQELESQTQLPDRQRWPGPQANPAPQRQAPDAQPPALAGSQVVHAEPASPHAGIEGARQVVPEQHPAGQEAASQMQARAEQRCPCWHAGPPPQEQAPSSEQESAKSETQFTQEEPPAPQASKDDGQHAPLEQQPVGHEVASHTHAPLRQRCPSAHEPQPGPASGPAGSARATSTVTS